MVRNLSYLLAAGVAFALGLAPVAHAQTRGITVELRASEAPDAPVVEEVRLYTASYALVIGIDDYTGGWPRLRNAVKDAELVAEELQARGFEVTLKTNLTSDVFQRVLKEFFALKGADPEARLLVWYSGHGYTLKGEGFLVPADAPLPTAPEFVVSALHMRNFGSLVRLASAKHVFSVFDSCFAGTVFENRSGPLSPAITRATTLPVREFLTSGDADQQVSDDGTFRTLFLRAIRGEEKADVNGDGYVTGSELGMFLADRVTNLTRGAQTPRAGKILDVKYDRGDFVFALAEPSAPAVPSTAPGGVATGGEKVDLAAEVALWEAAKEMATAAAYEDYLRRFPEGLFAEQARLRLDALTQQQAAVVPPPKPEAEPEAVQPAVGIYPPELRPGETFGDCAECPELAARLIPAVVNISTVENSRNRPLGSGFIVDPGGLIVTNAHIIEGADEIIVSLHDEGQYPARVLGLDAMTDLALLKIGANEPLPAVAFGDSDTALVGDRVIAIGKPLAFGNTVTAGIISAPDLYADVLRTDPPMNRGHSGGPLFNMAGEVIGVNTVTSSPGDTVIGFAVPAALAEAVIKQLREYGLTRRGLLGVRVQRVTEEFAEALELGEPKGALVASVGVDGPAEKAGIESGDVILKFDGKDITTMRMLPRVVAFTEIGKRVDVVVLRSGEELTFEVEVVEFEAGQHTPLVPASFRRWNEEARQMGSLTPEEAAALGMTFATITPEVRERFDLAGRTFFVTAGIVITQILEAGPAAQAGLSPGDMIIEVANETVFTPSQVVAKVAEARAMGRRRALMMLVWPGSGEGGLRYVGVPLD